MENLQSIETGEGGGEGGLSPSFKSSSLIHTAPSSYEIGTKINLFAL